jgi:phospholipase A1
MTRQGSALLFAIGLGALRWLVEAQDPGSAWGAEPERAALASHKPNYALVYTLDAAEAPDDRQEKEAKFQISLKARLPGPPPWYIGYTQKSFWQVYDRERSRPFRESNYNPELFLDWRAPFGAPPSVWLRYGIEHESNGQGTALSRSWNRVYLWPRIESERWDAALKYWYRLLEREKRAPGDPEGDDNPDIERYLGRFEAYLSWRPQPWAELRGMARKGTRDRSGTYEFNGLLDVLPGADKFWLQLQYFSGFGESLIDYNHRVDKVGIGVAFR